MEKRRRRKRRRRSYFRRLLKFNTTGLVNIIFGTVLFLIAVFLILYFSNNLKFLGLEYEPPPPPPPTIEPIYQ